MMRIRHTEEQIAARYSQGEMRCPTHLSIGQEAVATGVGLVLRTSDMAVSGHRAHAHYLAKGGDLTAMLAEIHGKETGCARGKGGSMHLIDEAVGFMGSTAIVGGTIPVGVGLGLGMKLAGTDQVACVFLGDAATETGAFYEAASFAALRKLPVLFICENNLYSVYTPLEKRQPAGREIWRMAAALGLASNRHYGNDVEIVCAAAGEAVAAIRAGDGPQFLEFSTYRWLEHCGPNYDNDIGYRTQEEFRIWSEQDPVRTYADRLTTSGHIDGVWLSDAAAAIAAEVDAAFASARAADFPAPHEAAMHLYRER